MVQAADLKTQLCVFVFDLLYLNDKVLLDRKCPSTCLFASHFVQSLLDEPLSKRRELLRRHFAEQAGVVQYVRSIDLGSLLVADDEEKLLGFLQAALEARCEGLMLKSLASPYEPSKRSLQWLKMKRDYMDGGGDTFDLVVAEVHQGMISAQQ